jgi:ATP-dependent protease HslVU (ClpYQ) peptidase subunit
MGPAETEGGELCRAMMRVMYRWENDGDQIMEGYGKETCNAAARSILDKLEQQAIDIEPLNINRIMDCGHNCFGDKYDLKIYEDAEYLLDVFDKHPELFEMKSTGDIFSYRDSVADVDNEDEDEDWYDNEEEDDEEYEY